MKFRQVIEDLDGDLRQVAKYSADFSGGELRWTRRLSMLATPTLMCATLYRVAHWLYVNRFVRLAAFVAWLNFFINKAIISPGAKIGPGFYIPHTVGVVFHAHAGDRLTLYAHAIVCSNTPDARKIDVSEDCPVLGDDVIVGAHAAIIGAFKIGSGSTIGLGVGLEENLLPRSIVIPNVSKTFTPDPAVDFAGVCEPAREGANES